MAQCDVGLSYAAACSVDKKLCRFGYTTTTWCPTCDEDSPRKRSKSAGENPNPEEIRRLRFARNSPRYDHENMMELDDYQPTVDHHRNGIRSNLCELPTTYINNCLKLSTDIEKLEKQPFKQHSETGMVDRQDKLNRLLPKIDESARNINGIVSKMKQMDGKKLKACVSVEPHLEAKEQVAIHYDTCSFFDKKVDVINLREQYMKEVEVLKEKLQTLKQDGHGRRCAASSGKRSLIATDDNLKKMDIKEVLRIFRNSDEPILTDLPSSLDAKIPESTPPPLPDLKTTKESQTKIGLKTTKSKICVKFRKPKAKIVTVNSKLSHSDECSDSEDSFKDVTESESLDDVSNSSSIKDLGSGDSLQWPIRPSLFPNIPPYILFVGHDCSSIQKFPAGSRHLKWKLSTITPILIRKTLVNSGLRLVRKSNEWLGTWGKHMKSPMFQTMKDTQKLNHFPGTFQLGRKDRLWRNLQRHIMRYGFREFGFTPQTYVLPQDLKLLKQHWQNKDTESNQKYIIKPPASARGTGIKVINRWNQLPKRMSLVVQEYISNPFLINNSKFDLRLYVLVTSFNPLRIYLYPEGLARFASVPYNDDPNMLRDKFMHLTNYSINKMSTVYTPNEDANSCKGHKWTLTKLWEYMSKRGINTKALWKNLVQLVTKTMISGEPSISTLCRGNIVSRYNCYELFGVDVLIDEYLKCWLLEVNISPSLHSQSPLDEYVKGPLIKSVFNLVQFHLPSKMKRNDISDHPLCYDPRIYTTTLTKKEINKHNYFSQVESRNEYLEDILTSMTGDDVRHLTQAEDELTVIGDFQRIFPTSQTYKYFEFMEVRYYNRLFDAWERKYEHDREPGIAILKGLCEQKLHLKVAPPPVINKNLPNLTPGGQENPAQPSQIDKTNQIASEPENSAKAPLIPNGPGPTV